MIVCPNCGENSMNKPNYVTEQEPITLGAMLRKIQRDVLETIRLRKLAEEAQRDHIKE